MNNNGNGHSKITPIPCPMCGGELIYSQGSHDLVCERNVIDNQPISSAGKNGAHAPREAEMDPPRGKSCIFAISLTESNNSGSLFSIRINHAETNYMVLSFVMREMQTRGRGQLARNWHETINHGFNGNQYQKRPNMPTDEKLAGKLGLEPEDLYCIKNSTETIKNLAQYYGLTEGQVRSIKKTVLCGNANSL